MFSRIKWILLLFLGICVVSDGQEFEFVGKNVTDINDGNNDEVEPLTTKHPFANTDFQIEDVDTKSEIEMIFNKNVSDTDVTGQGSESNTTDDESVFLNNTATETLGNHSNMEINSSPRISESQSENDGKSPLGVKETSAILGGVMVIIGIVGYLGFISWRRYLQHKYGTSEMLITDDVYDITDLRHFEI